MNTVQFTEEQVALVKEIKSRLGIPDSKDLKPLIKQWLGRESGLGDLTPANVDAFVNFVKDKYLRGL